VLTTHDLKFAGDLADRVFEISSQRLRQLAKVSA
jgi:ABC-type proline/glycine betaine transport system ATPase subunit